MGVRDPKGAGGKGCRAFFRFGVSRHPEPSALDASVDDTKILWDAPKKLSMRRALWAGRFDRFLSVSVGVIMLVGATFLAAVGFMHLFSAADPLDTVLFLVGFLLIGFGLVQPSGAVAAAYPLVRANLILVPAANFFSLRLAIAIPWETIADLKVARPKRETGPAWEQMGPDLRITIKTVDGRSFVLEYPDKQDLSWTVHDELARVLEGAWETRKPRGSAPH